MASPSRLRMAEGRCRWQGLHAELLRSTPPTGGPVRTPSATTSRTGRSSSTVPTSTAPDVISTWNSPRAARAHPEPVRPQAAGAAQPAHCVLDQRAGAERGRRSVIGADQCLIQVDRFLAVSYTHLRAHETRHDLVCRLL